MIKYYTLKDFESIFKVQNGTVYYSSNMKWEFLSIQEIQLTGREGCKKLTKNQYLKYPIIFEEEKKAFYSDVLSKSE